MNGGLLSRYRPGPFAQRIAITIIGLSLLFAFLAPDASKPLGFAARLLFWLLHIGIGLAACELAAEALIRLAPGLRDWRLVALAGITGVALFAPIAYGLAWLFPLAGDDPDALSRIAGHSLAGAIVVETLALAPPLLATWLVINVEPISAALRRDDGGPSSRSFTLRADAPPGTDAGAPAADARSEPRADEPAERRDAAGAFLARLPRAIGTDVLAVSSDLHYLQVFTRRGRAMVLGSLREVEAAYGAAGLRIHRAHWVHLDGVARVRRSGDSLLVETVAGQKLPVSRRKRREVGELLGTDSVRHGPEDLAG